jgi:hypothetical protein
VRTGIHYTGIQYMAALDSVLQYEGMLQVVTGPGLPVVIN